MVPEVEANVSIPIWKIILIFVPLVLITIAVLLGNLLVIVAILTQKFLRTVPNIYLVSLAVADLMVGVFILPPGIIEIAEQKWTMGKAYCEFWLTADVLLCTVSIFHLCVVAVDRYRSITVGVSYLQRRTGANALWTIAAIWLVALWISSPPVLGWNDWKHEEGFEICALTDEKGYVVHSALGSLIFPVALMIILYMKIYHAIQERLIERSKMPTVDYSTDCDLDDSSEQLDRQDSMPSKSENLSSTYSLSTRATKAKTPYSDQIQKIMKDKIRFSLTRERRAARTLGCIIIAFVGCWFPFGAMYIITPFLPEDYKPSVTVFQIFTWLGYINSALNPIIYTVFNTDFRRGFKGVLCILCEIRKP